MMPPLFPLYLMLVSMAARAPSISTIVDSPSTTAVVGAIGATAVAFGTYFVARRQGSGRIATSDAATLWAESQAMRRELREEVVGLRKEVLSLRQALDSTRSQLTAAHAEAGTLRHELGEARKQVDGLTRELRRLSGQMPPGAISGVD